ncbi:alanine--tRNA ligase, cytoplasmic-like [Paramacrobiotus metropolitanus]|uniref:alanine--tRNA ligase, cytoplasmic-like n=1 Tax=Paramacrobiotus metropolitanus TaxID=2943436 RepID=UPI002445A595|nr:alanine--tRNA ligase, cytoplasmic-like [Paramacrobiotus metropolitanus]XP_055346949.1 alanine--tRNA ligase, cytoplasmic-like [Paramacrobiotus metropolitanus]XP_055346957.1 alanine--tRNA ligase, cytoplasmic-like [Paramacrobiotus metropolitanus]
MPLALHPLQAARQPLLHAVRTLSPLRRYLHIEPLSSHEIRRRFLDYFAQNNHTIIPSSSVVPHNDTSLLFVNAGMNQFKHVLLGTEAPRHRRVANSQKCIRAGGKHNDLDEVGIDGRHHTYFEMLGNWSFGDYFQQEACTLAYHLLVDVYKLPKSRLYMTYFGGDPEVGLQPDFECREIWRRIGIAESQIIPRGMDDNFWAMGEEGPCGPCTEIHYSMDGSAEKLLEVWNLVFMQFNRTRRGILEPLTVKHVDTGMGLERLVAVLQDRQSNYDTDLFLPLLQKIPELAGTPPYQSKFGDDDHEGLFTAYRILADHARMCTVAIADGMLPDKRGAPYVLRKVLRRAALTWSNKLHSDPLLWAQLVPTIVQSLGPAYPEIAEREAVIQATITKEIEDFKGIVDKGTKAFGKIWQKLENKMVLPADKMYELYRQFGVPEEVIFGLARGRNMGCDAKGFYLLMDQERVKSREGLARKKEQVAQ